MKDFEKWHRWHEKTRAFNCDDKYGLEGNSVCNRTEETHG
jgi:hypothetical protein